MEPIEAIERRRPVRETPAEKLSRETAAFLVAVLRMVLLAMIVAPIILLAILAADIPIRMIDQRIDANLIKPGNWLSLGNLVMAAAAPVAILFARRFGGDEASRAITAAWAIAAIATFAEISYLAPNLAPADFPNVRFVVGFVSSAMLCQYVAVGIYDVTRGGGPSWRAPLISLLLGYAAYSLTYFSITYWNSTAPWFNWMITDYALKALIAFSFVPVYLGLQRAIRPIGGFGGR